MKDRPRGLQRAYANGIGNEAFRSVVSDLAKRHERRFHPYLVVRSSFRLYLFRPHV